MNHSVPQTRRGTPAHLLRRIARALATVAALALVILAFLGATSAAPRVAASKGQAGATSQHGQLQAQSQTWTTYGGNNAREGNNTASSSLTVNTAASLKPIWTLKGGSVSAQPIIANGMVYWGGWDGYERAATLDGTQVWATSLGVTDDAGCDPPDVGVASTGTIATVGGRTILFVGGGNATFYALDASTGQVVWSRSLGTSPATFIWASPAVYNGSVYIPISSFGDCPLIQGKLFRLDATTGTIQNFFDAAPSGCIGVSMWGSPAIDDAAGTVYVATGNPGSCAHREVYAESVVALRASNLSVISHWQVPAREAIGDGDFGATPTLYTAGGRRMIAVGNKNGIYYALDRRHLSAGPIWQARLATPYLCPDSCTGLIGMSSFTGPHLFVGGGQDRVGRQSCHGTLRALNPANGRQQWMDCLPGVVYGPVTSSNGIVTVAVGQQLYVMSTLNGRILYSYTAGGGAFFYAGSSVVKGRIYVGDMQGNLYCFG